MDNPNIPETNYQPPEKPPVKMYIYPTGGRELLFIPFLLFFSVFTCYGVLKGDFNLGYTLGFLGMAASCLLYLGKRIRLTVYSAIHLACVFGLACLFTFSGDSSVEILAFFVLLFAWQQTLHLLTNTGTFFPGTLASTLDAGKTLFFQPYRHLFPNLRGLTYGKGEAGLEKRKTGSVLLGLAISVPLLLMIIPLLMKADAAFEGLMDKFSGEDTGILIASVLLGILFAIPRFSRSLTLRRIEGQEKKVFPYKGSLSTGTITTALAVISAIFLLYLFSQLAYFFSGFAGLLPDGFTTAEYARRGFFEMCRMCALNLGILASACILVKKNEGKLTLPIRLLSLFVCLFSLVLVATSASKMALYIGTYGLTPKRIYTSVFMVFLAVAFIAVGIWLLKSKFPYMKVIVTAGLAALLLTGFFDVGTVVARYNVNAYQTGKLETVDVQTVYDAGSGGTPYLVQLLEDDDPAVAAEAKDLLASKVSTRERYEKYTYTANEDGTFTMEKLNFWEWNYKSWQEMKALEEVLPILHEKNK